MGNNAASVGRGERKRRGVRGGEEGRGGTVRGGEEGQ